MSATRKTSLRKSSIRSGYPGFYRPIGRRPAAPRHYLDEWNVIWQLTEAPKAHTALLQEIGSWAQSTAETRAARNVGDRPLLVISSEKTAVSHDVWIELQAELSRLSTRSTHIEVEHSSGDLVDRAPDAILAAVHQVVAAVTPTAAHSPDARLLP